MSIGIFDSGIGGLSVWAELRVQLPQEAMVYYADQANFPYGIRSPAMLRSLSEKAVDYLLGFGVKVVVIACNTASAAALKHLRIRYPNLAFVGMEPAVKPAAALSRSRVVAVLATPVTLEGELLEGVIERFAQDVTVVRQPCQGLVECVENGEMWAKGTRQILEDHINPCLGVGADTLVLGCTHYSFVSGLIREMYPQLTVIDPAGAVARRVKSLFDSQGDSPDPAVLRGEHILVTSGSVESFKNQFKNLFGNEIAEVVTFQSR